MFLIESLSLAFKQILKQNTKLSPRKQSIANKYVPINTQNIGFIRENIELNTLYINVLIYSSLNMFSSTKLENRPRSTLREQRIFYNRSQISINIQSWFWLNKCSAEYNTQQQFSEDSAFSCWYVELIRDCVVEWASGRTSLVY
jgi:hypothetical protein